MNKNGNIMLGWIVVLVAMMGMGCSRNADAEKEVKLIRPVRYVTVARSNPVIEKTFSGMIIAGTSVRMSFKVSGTIDKIPVNVGDTLSKNDLMAILDPVDYRLKIEAARATLASTEAQSRNAAANYKRVQALYENKNVSLNDLDASRAAAESAAAAVKAVKKQLTLAQNQLDYTRLLAPADCKVAMVLSEQNENIAAGHPVVVVNYLDALEVKVALPASVISQLCDGDEVNVSVNSVGMNHIKGVVTEVGVASTLLQTTFPVTVALNKVQNSLRPGMAADVTFNLSKPGDKTVLMVPPIAVGEDRNGRFVYVVLPDTDGTGRVEYRAVTLGGISEHGLEITGGLVPGEKIVTAGLSRIVDGLKVKI